MRSASTRRERLRAVNELQFRAPQKFAATVTQTGFLGRLGMPSVTRWSDVNTFGPALELAEEGGF